jgi:hypothetical protein
VRNERRLCSHQAAPCLPRKIPNAPVPEGSLENLRQNSIDICMGAGRT